jgi:hypothetical protein
MALTKDKIVQAIVEAAEMRTQHLVVDLPLPVGEFDLNTDNYTWNEVHQEWEKITEKDQKQEFGPVRVGISLSAVPGDAEKIRKAMDILYPEET